MKISINKIHRHATRIRCDGEDVCVFINDTLVCKFVPTDPTGFICKFGDYESYSNEIMDVEISDLGDD